MASYLAHIAIMVASPSPRGNIRRLQRPFSTLSTRCGDIGVYFAVPKTELVHGRTPSWRTHPSSAPIELEGHLFHPSKVVRWLEYWFTPALTSGQHFGYRLSLAQAGFFFVKRLFSLGVGVTPFLCHRIANSLLLPSLAYGADLLTPNDTALRTMDSFWHRVQRWTTNNLFSSPTSILSRAACLPPIIFYCRSRRRLTALRIACAPPYANPASARLPKSFPSRSSLRARTHSGTLRMAFPLFTSPLTGGRRFPLCQ